jgi:hypothetical protein
MYGFVQEEAKEAKKKDPLLPLTVDELRGDLTEEHITDTRATKLLQDIDHDKSQPLNSKDRKSLNSEFVKTLFNENKDKFSNPNEVMDHIKNEVTKYYPIDIIKNNTLWELKSFSKETNPNKIREHSMSESKIAGHNKYKIKYINTGTNESPKYKIDNIYYETNWNPEKNHFSSKKSFIPTLPVKPNGYDYYWLFNNLDRVAYKNPLMDEKFKPTLIKKEPNKYLASWEGAQKENPESKKEPKFLVKNTDLLHLPTRYPKEYVPNNFVANVNKKYNEKIEKEKIEKEIEKEKKKKEKKLLAKEKLLNNK